MKYSNEALIKLTETCEGYRSHAYPDPGTGGAPWTAGFGHTGDDVTEDTACSLSKAFVWLIQDMDKAAESVSNLVTVPLNQQQFDALCDFTYNVGVGNLARSTLLKLINQGNFVKANAEFGKWVFAAGKKLPGLIKRRQMESDWFTKGVV